MKDQAENGHNSTKAIENGSTKEKVNGEISSKDTPVDEESNTKDGEDKVKHERFSYGWFGFEFPDDTHQAPQLSPLEIYSLFLSFGCRAFGGPVAQINMMKEELVIQKKWITNDRFNRVFAVYAILPGPEAAELACYFGMLAGGRLGALLGGLGFVTPGVLLMIFWSWIYVNYVDTNPKIKSSFHCLQVVVAAYIFKACFKLAEHALYEKKDKIFNWAKGFLCLFCFLTAVIKLNFFISLGVSAIMNAVFVSKYTYRNFYAIFIAACTLGFYYLYVNQRGPPTGSMVGGRLTNTGGTSLRGLFILSLIAGLVSFGGAYTTLPFIYTDAVETNGWLTNQEFLDCLAVVNILPTPLVTFITMVGFIASGIAGSVIMTIGIFLPAFSFPIIGHRFFEALVDNKYVADFLDGIAAAVIGLLSLTAFVFLKGVVHSGLDAVVFLLAFYGVFYFTDKYTQPIGIFIAAVAGQVLYHY